MAFPEEAVWRTHHGKPSNFDIKRAGRFIIGPHDIVEWEIKKYNGRFYAINNYFTWAEAWDNAWMESFGTEDEAVTFARKNALEAQKVMTASRKKHGKADPYDVAAVVNVGRYEPPPPPARGGLGSIDEPMRSNNLIGHASDWEGTLRTYKALTAIERFHPRNASQIARIFIEEQNPIADMREMQFPMFLENTALYNFVLHNLDANQIDRAGNYFVTHWDITQGVADMWRLSPVLQEAFPSTNHWFNGINIGEGWFDLLDKVKTIVRRAE